MLSRLLSYNLSALALTRPPSLNLSVSLSLLLVHAFGLALVAQLTRVPLWIVAIVLAIFVLAQFFARLHEIISPALLAPFFFVYIFVTWRFVWLRVFGGEIEGYFDYTLPDPRVLLHFEFFIGAAILYGALILCSFLVSPRTRAIHILTFLCALAVFVWAAFEYFGHRTFGVTGSDPFAYVQMGVDLATRGTAAHRFELFPIIAAEKILWYPILHVGYRLPYNLQGDAITVWSIGGSFAYAFAYRIAGERALYLVNPFFSLLSILVSGLLAWELTRNESKTIRVVTTCLVAFIIATSNEILNWAGVTMVDTQALVFSTLAFYCALRVYRTGKWRWAIGAGVCWGFAYFVRHTQFVIAFAFLPLFFLSLVPRITRFRNLIAMGAAAFLIAIPDLWYHQTYLGNWLTPESEELALFSLSAIPQTLGAIGQSAFIGSEFGWLAVFILLGIVFYTRREKVSSIALLLWLGAAMAIHLPYAALRLRDLIPQFPILAFFASYGVVATIAALWQKQNAWAKLLAPLLIFLALELMLVRVWNTLPRVTQDAHPRFGAMTQTQRASFDELARVTPQNAIIGASLNSGAIDLYAHRNAFRPADWSSDNLHQFMETARANNYEIYVLEENASLTRVLNELREAYRVERVTTLDVPSFGSGLVTDAGALWKITRR